MSRRTGERSADQPDMATARVARRPDGIGRGSQWHRPPHGLQPDRRLGLVLGARICCENADDASLSSRHIRFAGPAAANLLRRRQDQCVGESRSQAARSILRCSTGTAARSRAGAWAASRPGHDDRPPCGCSDPGRGRIQKMGNAPEAQHCTRAATPRAGGSHVMSMGGHRDPGLRLLQRRCAMRRYRSMKAGSD
jgi:hypothetical protein